MLRLKVCLLLVLGSFNSTLQAGTTPKESSHFVSATLKNEIPLEFLKVIGAGLNHQVASKIKYGVRSHVLVYETTFNGKKVKASGLILVPVGLKGTAPILSLQHGTTFLKRDAPSLSQNYYGMEFFAAAGYVTLIPDFLGYGESAKLFHPYYHEQSSALTVIDMIHAAKEFLVKEKINVNEDLFLAGYSEGGYVTLATAHAIDVDPQHKLKVKAVAAGAGGYDLKGMLKEVTTQNNYAYPGYLAFVLMSYNSTYNWNKPLDSYFNPKYAKALEEYMDGTHDGWFVNTKLTTSISGLFNPTFYESLEQKTGALELKKALVENSIDGWNASFPVRLYHSRKDEIIPYANSESMLADFKKAGAKSVYLVTITGNSHASSFMPMIQAFVPWFEELR
jgi:pimeloyl-ACP methyl ester carboxylesterase